jgi:N-acetylmuramoyl-L-alanine amidase
MSRTLIAGWAKGDAIAIWVIGCSAGSLLTINLNHSAIAADSENVVNHAQNVAQVRSEVSVNRPTLKLGSEGVQVSELQATLKLLGYYSGIVNGVYGNTTAIAVSKFQRSAGLNADGIVGAETWKRLFPATPSATTQISPSNTATPTLPSSSIPDRASVAPDASVIISANRNPPNSPAPRIDFPILKLGMEGSAVAGLQDRLRALGFYKGSVDGVFGSETQAAVKLAQQNFNLNPDGVVGSATWTVLLH